MVGVAPATSPPNIVVGVTGGIAAYKAVAVVRELVRSGAHVTVIATASALRFVGTPTWEAVSRNPVATDLFDAVAQVRHVALGQNADLIVVAPATANALAHIAGGFAGDLLGTTLLASAAPILLAPAMHTEMWDNPAVQANIATLQSRGYHLIGPESGPLTGGDVGIGRMSEPSDIAARALGLLGPKPWAGKRVLISAGGTREPLDPVRFIGNRSSGHMGVALVRAAQARGADVTLVHANLDVPLPANATCIAAGTSALMREAMLAHCAQADIIVMAAAVADWVPKKVSAEKISKASLGASWAPVLIPGPDILAELGTVKKPDQLLVGFAAESADDPREREASARAKLVAKNCDVLVLNQVGDQVGFGPVDTAVTLFYDASPQSLSFDGTKISVAESLMEALQDR